MNERHIAYIEQDFLKKGQVLGPIEAAGQSEAQSAEVFKVSSRYRKRTGRFDWFCSDAAAEQYDSAAILIPSLLRKVFHSPKVSKTESELRTLGLEEIVLRVYMEQNLLMRRTDYGADGRTTLRMVYVQGLTLHAAIQEERQAAQAEEMQHLRRLVDRIEAAKGALSSSHLSSFHHRLGELLDRIIDELAHAYSDHLEKSHKKTDATGRPDPSAPGEQRVLSTPDLPAAILDPAWSAARHAAYVDFLIAIAEISSVRSRFDWKEIGARFYGEIGGSKRFDIHKELFISTLENQLDMPSALLGLSSTGSLYAVYAAGQLSGERGLFYPYGYIHALTDLTIFQMKLQSNCRCLWLVENRAVLTRMAAEGDFLEKTGSLVVGLDGQLRGAQKQLIRSLIQHSPHLEQVRIWCDYDHAGFVIAGHTRDLLEEADRDLDVRWIAIDSSLPGSGVSEHVTNAYDWNAYSRMAAAYTEAPAEQEIELGGADDWKQWISV